MSDINNVRLYKHIIQHLSDEILTGKLSEDVIESLEVAKQCLETAFDLSEDYDKETHSLLKVYETGLATLSGGGKSSILLLPDASIEEKKKAEQLKTQGNSCMSQSMFKEAVDCYSEAIDLDKKNAVYYCNRAAANSRLNENQKAITDCETALTIDPNYSKAFGRMGLAFSALNNHAKAVECYKRALELDPENATYRSSLTTAEGMASSPAGQAGPRPPAGATLGGLDINALLSSPQMMNVASQMMSNPQMQQMMTNLMSNMSGAPEGGATSTSPDAGEAPQAPTGAEPNMNDFLRMGQQFAQQMRTANPELVDNLRQQMQTDPADATTPPDQPNPNGNGD